MTDLPYKTLPDSEAARDVLTAEVANLTLKGHSPAQIARDLGWTRHQIRKLMDRPYFEQYLADIESNAKRIAKTYIRKSVQGLAPKIVAALERLIDKDNAKGVELALRTVGAMETEDPDQDKANKPIQIFMPGATVKQETTIEVPSENKQTGD